MHHIRRFVSSLLLAAALISLVMITGCAARASYRVYDPDYDDYHRWDGHETTFYLQWEGESHREHRDFDKRDKDEQKEYWNWRHKHSEKDHDKH
jgi:hypothetical protein